MIGFLLTQQRPSTTTPPLALGNASISDRPMLRSFDFPLVAESANIAAARPLLENEYRHSADEDGITNNAKLRLCYFSSWGKKCRAVSIPVLDRLSETLATTSCPDDIENLQQQQAITQSSFTLRIPKSAMFLVILVRLFGELSEERWESMQACTSWHIGEVLKTDMSGLVG